MGVDVLSHHGHLTTYRPILADSLALFAKRLSARSLTEVFGFNVVARIAVCIVVMHGLLDGMPRGFLHGLVP